MVGGKALKTTASQKCEAVPRRARIQGSYDFCIIRLWLVSNKARRRRKGASQASAMQSSFGVGVTVWGSGDTEANVSGVSRLSGLGVQV